MSVLQLQPPLSFELPPHLEASLPAEARGLRRDEVRLMASYAHSDRLIHTQFFEIPNLLTTADLLVINTSGTLPAALPAIREDGSELRLHLSSRLPAGLWTAELREPSNGATQPFYRGKIGETLSLPGGAKVSLLARYQMHPEPPSERLWIVSFDLSQSKNQKLESYLWANGKPIRYNYVAQDWPLEYYQTTYATEFGSAEMPSAGRAFTPEVITALVAKGIRIAPLILHTGVASLESHEPPYEEYFRVSAETANAVNQTRQMGGRAIAVGTTVVRALETVTDTYGSVHPGEGWTKLMVTPERGVRVVDGLLTGWHEPKATHLAMLEAIAGRKHLQVAYNAAFEHGYLWHEFGDLHLILP